MVSYNGPDTLYIWSVPISSLPQPLLSVTLSERPGYNVHQVMAKQCFLAGLLLGCPLEDVFELRPPGPVNMAFFRNRVIAAVISQDDVILE